MDAADSALTRKAGLTEARIARIPSKLALAKAEAEGFDSSKFWYHGTHHLFDAFVLPKEAGTDELGPGVYLTSKKWIANTVARDEGVILTCVIRRGPLFNLGISDDEMMPTLMQGYAKRQVAQRDAEHFRYVWNDQSNRRTLVNLCLSGAGYVGAFKVPSTVAGQVVIFRPEDVRIVARESGKRHMSAAD